MSFSQNVGGWAKDAKKEMADLNKAIAFELFASIILDTPVLEGRLRGNWVISSDNPASGTVEVSQTTTGSESKNRNERPRGPVTTKTVHNVSDFLGKVNFESDVDLYLTNNLPYAYRIEYDGYSKVKAPAGMVRKNFIRISENLAANT